MPAFMQPYGAKQGSGCLREQSSEQSFRWMLNGCWKLKMGRDLLGCLGFALLAQSSRDHLHCPEPPDTCSSRTRTLLHSPQTPTQSSPPRQKPDQALTARRSTSEGQRKGLGLTCCEILTLARPRGPCMASDTSYLASLHSAHEKS